MELHQIVDPRDLAVVEHAVVIEDLLARLDVLKPPSGGQRMDGEQRMRERWMKSREREREMGSSEREKEERAERKKKRMWIGHSIAVPARISTR